MKGASIIKKYYILIMTSLILTACSGGYNRGIKIELYENTEHIKNKLIDKISENVFTADDYDKNSNLENVLPNTAVENNKNTNLEADNDNARPDWWKAEDYLWQEIPELRDIGAYISKKTEGKAFLLISSTMEPIEVYNRENRDEVLGNYYLVYVGDKWEDGHTANWYWFYVSEEIDEILWCEIVENEDYSLEEWRNSSKYKEQMVIISEMLQQSK